ncbi:lipopolysaccharide biosynthesis protein [Novipirellula sp.]|uniref:lipopolysaccharide biosynthesis protein n=1 Tax=Novipirellula sp. TaxID=2795430 RepID=UPI0035691CA6
MMSPPVQPAPLGVQSTSQNHHSASVTSTTGRSDFRSTVAFLSAAVLRKFGSAVWIPVLLALVSPADFSRYGMLLAAVNLLVPLLSLGIVFAPMRLAFDHPQGAKRNSLFRTTLFTTTAIAGTGLTLTLAILLVAVPDDPLTHGSSLLRCCIAFHVFAAILSEFAFSLLRVKGQAVRFALAACVYAFAPFFISLPFLLWTSTEPLIVISASMACGLFGAFLIAMHGEIKRILLAAPEAGLLSSLLHYSLPVSMHLIGLWAINASGRWIGTISQTLEEMASFTLFSAIASLLMGFPVALLEARLPKYNSAFGRREYSQAISILSRCMALALAVIVVIYLLIATSLYFGAARLPVQYIPSKLTLGCFCLFNLFHCIYLIGVNILSGLKRTSFLAAATIVAGSVTIAVSYFGCLWYGEIGLVIAMVSGMLCQAGVVNLVAFHLVSSAPESAALPLHAVDPSSQDPSPLDPTAFHTIVEESEQVCEGLDVKNHRLRSFAEFILRTLAFACNTPAGDGGPPTGCCHYIHDPRLARFDTPGSFHVCTSPRSIRFRKIRPSVVVAIVRQYRRLARSIKPQCPLASLTLLDLACITYLSEQHGVRSFHVAAHFQPYVAVLSELRRKQLIDVFTGHQHGAWELRPLEKIQRRLFFDRYHLLDTRFQHVFEKYLSGNPSVRIEASDLNKSMRWLSRGTPHVALGFQGKDYPPNWMILEIVSKVCKKLQIDLVVYPHPKESEASCKKVATIATVERTQRYSDSLVFVSAFSTLGLEFALNGRPAIFVNINDRRIVFDETGLDTSCVQLDALESALLKHLQP